MARMAWAVTVSRGRKYSLKFKIKIKNLKLEERRTRSSVNELRRWSTLMNKQSNRLIYIETCSNLSNRLMKY